MEKFVFKMTEALSTACIVFPKNSEEAGLRVQCSRDIRLSNKSENMNVKVCNKL
jgi:hypothetical protein